MCNADLFIRSAARFDRQGKARQVGATSLVSKTDVVRLGMRCSTSARYAVKLGVILTLAVKPTCFQRRSRKFAALAPLGERGDRKAGGEGVVAKMEFV